MKIYISGPITGQNEHETALAFRRPERVIRNAGHTAVNPHRLARYDLSWVVYMDLARCIIRSGEIDAIYMLEGWQNSFGATLERSWATHLGIPVLYQSERDRKRYGKPFENREARYVR